MTSQPYRSPYSSLFLSLASQVAAFGATAILFNAATFHPWFFIALQAVVAAALARFLRLSRSWQLFNLLLVPLVLSLSGLQLPSWLWAALAVFFFLVYFPTLWTRVPYYPTPDRMYSVVAEALPQDKEFSFIDLGCGFSGMLCFLSDIRPLGKFVGQEISPLPFAISHLRSLFRRNRNLKVSPGNFWKHSLSSYDVVYAFLAPPPMEALWEKVKKEMKPGSLFITNTFPVNETADYTREVTEGRKFVLYFHRR